LTPTKKSVTKPRDISHNLHQFSPLKPIDIQTIEKKDSKFAPSKIDIPPPKLTIEI